MVSICDSYFVIPEMRLTIHDPRPSTVCALTVAATGNYNLMFRAAKNSSRLVCTSAYYMRYTNKAVESLAVFRAVY